VRIEWEKGKHRVFHPPAKSSDVAKTINMHDYVSAYVELATCDNI
jgi:hypothetical protein